MYKPAATYYRGDYGTLIVTIQRNFLMVKKKNAMYFLLVFIFPKHIFSFSQTVVHQFLQYTQS